MLSDLVTVLFSWCIWKLVGEMNILVHNEPLPVLQIITVPSMEYQIKKVLFHMCCFSIVIEMKPIHVTRFVHIIVFGYLGTYFRTYMKVVSWQPFSLCSAWVKDVCLIFLCESITRVILHMNMSLKCTVPKTRHLTYPLLFIFKEENFLPNEEVSVRSISW